MVWTDPPNWVNGQSMGAYQINKFLRDDLMHLMYSAQPERCTLWHDASIVTNGAGLLTVVNAAYYEGFVVRQDPAADGDAFTHSFVLAPGFVYQLGYTGSTGSNAGKLDLFIDGAYITTWDLYAASSTPQFASKSGYYYATPGRHVLTGVINGQNAGSSGYNANIAKIFFVPIEEGDL